MKEENIFTNDPFTKKEIFKKEFLEISRNPFSQIRKIYLAAIFLGDLDRVIRAVKNTFTKDDAIKIETGMSLLQNDIINNTN